ncbi:hypothetical protein HQQ82_08580 [Rathayibacter sp. VKM Ac-2856]|uniref:hypothetical protein n=1 Tax=unclassified Rathayibacter TaxID=2609250 RepID=UPI0015642024|nr:MULTISPECIES: hypothetical protein [unclassified Rathayibacter]NQX04856.1 hypothetical protein [Rathayibacter sp. VKM Ac-2858]NQX20024.1 hypothetical protein [Rathayibacter sp. VKM Ac-2856]
MTAVAGALTKAPAGLALGAAAVFLGLMGSLSFALATDEDVVLPGMLAAQSTTENGLPALMVEPNPAGMLSAVLAIALAYTVAASVILNRSSTRSARRAPSRTGRAHDRGGLL